MGGVGAIAALGHRPVNMSSRIICSESPSSYSGEGVLPEAATATTSACSRCSCSRLVFMDTDRDDSDRCHGRGVEVLGVRDLRSSWRCSSTAVRELGVGCGWLSQLGANFRSGSRPCRFAGSSGCIWSAASRRGRAIVLGPRIVSTQRMGAGRDFQGTHPDGTPRHLHPGFGCLDSTQASTLAGGDLASPSVAVNTMLAGAAGAVRSMILRLVAIRKPPDHDGRTAC